VSLTHFTSIAKHVVTQLAAFGNAMSQRPINQAFPAFTIMS
jgi:hypothetical protein